MRAQEFMIDSSYFPPSSAGKYYELLKAPPIGVNLDSTLASDFVNWSRILKTTIIGTSPYMSLSSTVEAKVMMMHLEGFIQKRLSIATLVELDGIEEKTDEFMANMAYCIEQAEKRDPVRLMDRIVRAEYAKLLNLAHKYSYDLINGRNKWLDGTHVNAWRNFNYDQLCEQRTAAAIVAFSYDVPVALRSRNRNMVTIIKRLKERSKVRLFPIEVHDEEKMTDRI